MTMVNHPNRSRKSPGAQLRASLAEHWREIDPENPPFGRVLLYWPPKDHPRGGQFLGERIDADYATASPHRPPTHYMPLPAPPVKSEAK